MFRIFAFGLVLALAVATVAHATPTITLDDQVLLPDLAGQVLTINVTGGDLVPAVNLFLEIGDATSGPTITSFDFNTGTIFNPVVNSGPTLYVGALGTRTIGVNVSVTVGFATAEGTIARITIDTTGLASGTFPYRIMSVPDPAQPGNIFDTDFGADFDGNTFVANLIYTNPGGDRPFSNLTIFELPEGPEPGTIVLALFGLAALCAAGRRKLRTTSSRVFRI